MRQLFSLIIILCRTPSCKSSCVSFTWFFTHTFTSSTLSHPGKLSEMKSTWSPGPISHSQASLSHELWKVPQGPRSSNTAPSRPPPGLTNTKPSSTWGGSSLGLAQGWSSSYTTGIRTVKYLGLNMTGLGLRLAQLVEQASHVQRLCPCCSGPGFDSRPHSPSLSTCFLSPLQLFYQ